MNPQQDDRLDPVTFTVLLNRLDGIATEMTVSLENAAMTSILALARDYSCCIYDSQFRQVAMVDAIPIHTNSMHLLLGEIAERFGDDVHDGDVIACNYAYSGNTHIGDLVTVCPVFHDGEPVFWAAAKGHQLDVGAPVASTAYAWATDVWQEGFKIPPVKLRDRGTMRSDVVDLYLANMRWRDSLEGDLMAMLGSIWTAERRLKELCDEHGLPLVRRFLDAAIEYGAERTKAEIREIPNGTYRAEAWVDTDGIDEFDIPVRCEVTVHDDSVEVDYAGSAPQMRTSANASAAVMQSAGGIPVVSAIDPAIPHNEGCLRRIEVRAPEGSVCNAAWPAATAAATTTPGDAMQDAVSKALAQAVPGRVRAGTAHWSNIAMLSGADPETGALWGHMLLNGGGGGGAGPRADGWPLFTTGAAQGGLKTASVEHTEQLYPVRFHEWELAEDSMGLGERIGGPGVRCTIEPLGAPLRMVGRSDGQRNPPFGLAGGTPGCGGGHFLSDAGEGRRFLAQAFDVELSPGERWTGVSTGGGGFGDPLERPAERVREDVRDGLYSAERALEVFAVVLGAELELDAAATAELRERRRAERGPLSVVQPGEANAATWLEEQLGPNDEVVPQAGGWSIA